MLARCMTTALLVVSGCHDVIDGAFPYVCPSSTPIEALPERLSETGLYTDLANDSIAPGVLSYRQRFELWSDGRSAGSHRGCSAVPVGVEWGDGPTRQRGTTARAGAVSLLAVQADRGRDGVGALPGVRVRATFCPGSAVG
jgi:hypothetical protein